jgi:hypothetical protein
MSFSSLVRRADRVLARRLLAPVQMTPRHRTIVASDFLTGGAAFTARATDAKGAIVHDWQRAEWEDHAGFVQRVEQEAGRAARIVIGGLGCDDAQDHDTPNLPPPAGAIILPEGGLHKSQREALNVVVANRFTALRCGRRYGKSALAVALAVDAAALGQSVGVFAPTYKLSQPTFAAIAKALAPIGASANRSAGIVQVPGGGNVDVWTLDRALAGRGRRYHLAILDEAAFGGVDLLDIWRASIQPTLLDFRGKAVVASTPHGVDESNFFWQVCHQTDLGFAQFHAPTSANPFMPADELARLEREHHPLIFRQEFLAEFVDLSGVSLFSVEKLLEDGQPVALQRTDAIFAVIDSGMKGGIEHDGSAALYVAVDSTASPPRLLLVDWEIVSLGAGDLDQWLIGVHARLIALHRELRPRAGSYGIFIEAMALGEMLLAKAPGLGISARPIDTALVSRGKDLRALAAEPHVSAGRVKITHGAYNKTSNYRGVTRNQLLAQLSSFRVGDRAAYKRVDDLLDCATFAILIAFGDSAAMEPLPALQGPSIRFC